MLPSIRRAAATTKKSDRFLESGTPVDFLIAERYHFTSSLIDRMDLDLSRDEVECGDLYGGGSFWTA
jgi:hypothetical protein